MSNAAKRVERGGGQSMRIGQGGGASEQLKTIEDMKTAKDISDIPTAGDQYDSAEKIYCFLAAQQNGMSALNLFCINDLYYTMGWVSGASVDAAIGVGAIILPTPAIFSKGRRPSMSKPRPPWLARPWVP
ncbi:hypothetical protein [Agrobacterium tumefaciens]|uniref:hypothetical protein n=1 Tax=Agrobacterium tumefaciens TaxID=358 RepID=UPI001F286636